MPSRSTAWISEAGTPEAAASSSRVSVAASSSAPAPRATATAAARSASRRIELAAEHAADRGQGQPLALQLADPADPLGVGVVVPGHATFARRLRQEPARLVEAHGVDRHVAGGRQLFDPIPHDQTLYECALQPSHHALERRTGAAPGYDAPREARSSRGRHRRRARLRVRDDGARHRPEEPVRRRGLQQRAPVPPALLHGHRAAARHRAAGRRAAAVLRPVPGVGQQLRRVPRAHDVPDAGRRVVLRQRLRVVLLRERGAAARVRDRRPPLCLWMLGGLAGAVVRARTDAAGLRHDQLGSRGGGAVPRPRWSRSRSDETAGPAC